MIIPKELLTDFGQTAADGNIVGWWLIEWRSGPSLGCRHTERFHGPFNDALKRWMLAPPGTRLIYQPHKKARGPSNKSIFISEQS